MSASASRLNSANPPSIVAGVTGAQKHWSCAAFPAGTTNVTIQNQIPAPTAATGFRPVYNNGTTTASAVTTAKFATTETDGDNGSTLTYTSGSFSGAATATLAAATGTAPHEVRSIVVGDHVSLPIGASGFLIARTYFSGSGCADNPAAGELAAFRTATGLKYKTGFAAGAVLDSAGITMSEGQLVVPQGVIWTFDKPTYTLACVGGSNLRGQGTTANAMGIAYRTSATLSNSSRIVTPYIGAISGQGTVASMQNAKNVIEAIRPDFLLFLAGSGNDSDLSATGFEAMKGRTAYVIDLCRRNGVTPILGTLAPSTSLSAPQETLRLAQNEWVRGLRHIVAVADIAAAVEDPANRGQLLSAYDSGDGTHFNDAGTIAAAIAPTRVINQLI